MPIPGLITQKTPVAVADTISVTVDGKAIQVPKTMLDPITGKPVPTTMIQACAAASVDVPHYCYHPKLPVAGNCRMCLVEFGTPAMGLDRKPVSNPDGTPKIARSQRPAIACATPISAGMEIYTTTPGVTEMRKGVLEFLLINHPLDCPICDQAGECKLQEYSVEYGQAMSRFAEEKVHKPKQVDLGPRIVLDDERCILCSRCVRFTKDIVGDDALGFVNRGSYNTLTHYPGKPFDNNYTLNTVDICPVGALTSKDFRFRMRVWFLKEAKSICSSCATGCNIVVSSREEKIYRFEPRQNDAVNSTWMCDYGRLNYKWVGRPDRLSAVTLQKIKGFPVVSNWETALKEIQGILALVLPGSMAIIASARQTTEDLFLLQRLGKRFNSLTDSIPRQGPGDNLLLSEDRNPNTRGVILTGISRPQPGADLPKIAEGIRSGTIRTLIVFGEDVTCHGLEVSLLERLETLIVSDILPNATTALAHYLLPGCAHLEKRGTYINKDDRIQRFLKTVEPPGAARPESEFLLELLADPHLTAARGHEGLFNQMSQEISALQGIKWADLGDQGKPISPVQSV